MNPYCLTGETKIPKRLPNSEEVSALKQRVDWIKIIINKKKEQWALHKVELTLEEVEEVEARDAEAAAVVIPYDGTNSVEAEHNVSLLSCNSEDLVPEEVIPEKHPRGVEHLPGWFVRGSVEEEGPGYARDGPDAATGLRQNAAECEELSPGEGA